MIYELFNYNNFNILNLNQESPQLLASDMPFNRSLFMNLKCTRSVNYQNSNNWCIAQRYKNSIHLLTIKKIHHKHVVIAEHKREKLDKKVKWEKSHFIGKKGQQENKHLLENGKKKIDVAGSVQLFEKCLSVGKEPYWIMIIQKIHVHAVFLQDFKCWTEL